MTSGAISLPVANPGLLSQRETYYPSAVVEGGKATFFEVMIAAEPLTFQQRARAYWLLTDVHALQAQTGKPSAVVLMIGNLEGTSYSRSSSAGAVRMSVDDVRSRFRPALDSGFLEIREYALSQTDIDLLSAQLNA